MIADAPTLVDIEPMRAEHADAVASIESEWQPRPWSPEVFRAEVARDDRAYLVAVAGEGLLRTVVGYGGITVGAGEAHVMTIAVATSHRRRGVGRRLLLALLDAAREAGVDAVTLEVRESNDAAALLYEEVGFVSSGVRPNYYADSGEGARILWLHGLQEDETRARLADLAASAAAAAGDAASAPDGEED